jgi:hypothetical protein
MGLTILRNFGCSYQDVAIRHERDCHSRENEWDGMRLNGNGIGFENTVDYCP